MALTQQPSVNRIRQEALVAEFREYIGNRILVMTESYPFFYVGRITDVESDTVFIKVEISNVPEFDNIVLRIHIENIQVYFIETPQHPIPEIRL